MNDEHPPIDFTTPSAFVSCCKALEIYNGTGTDVDLVDGGSTIEIYFNGSGNPDTTIVLPGVIPSGGVYVMADDNATPAIQSKADQTSTSSFFNGDDAVALVKGGAFVDVIGQIGVDPGSAWGAGLISTQNHTLRRRSTVCTGDPNGTDAFDPSIEWLGLAQDTFEGLGRHTATSADLNAVVTWDRDPESADPATRGRGGGLAFSHAHVAVRPRGRAQQRAGHHRRGTVCRVGRGQTRRRDRTVCPRPWNLPDHSSSSIPDGHRADTVGLS